MQAMHGQDKSIAGSEAIAESAGRSIKDKTSPAAATSTAHPALVTDPGAKTSMATTSLRHEAAAHCHEQDVSNCTVSDMCDNTHKSVLELKEGRAHQDEASRKHHQRAKQADHAPSSVQEGTVTVLTCNGLLGLAAYGDTESDSDS